MQVFRGQKYQAAYPIPKVSSAFCYEKHPFDAGTKSIETSIATRIDAVRRGFADTESIEPDIDTKSRRGEIDTKRIASANRNTMAQPAKSPAPKIWIRQIKAAAVAYLGIFLSSKLQFACVHFQIASWQNEPNSKRTTPTTA